jgi:hypothetical protein
VVVHKFINDQFMDYHGIEFYYALNFDFSIFLWRIGFFNPFTPYFLLCVTFFFKD